MRYESEVLYDLMKRDGLLNPSQSNLPYESELKEKYVNDVKGAYPKVTDYRPEWLNYNLGYYIPADFPTESLVNVTSGTVNNVVPYAFKRAILKGQTLVNIKPKTPINIVGTETTYDENTGICSFNTNKGNLDFSSELLKSSTNYLAVVEIIKVPDYVIEHDFPLKITLGNSDEKFINISKDEIQVGIVKKTITSSRNIKDNLTIAFRGEFSTSIEFKVMILEYQEGMENWDIPYFEGMQSVKLPVLTTSNEDGTKTNILTVNEDVTLRGIGDTQDTLDCLTGEVTERIGEIVLDGSEDEKWTTSLNSVGVKRFVPNITIGANTSTLKCICDKYVNYNTTTHNQTENCFRVENNDKIYIIDTNYNDVESFKLHLQSNPIKIQYELAEKSIKTVDLTSVNQDGVQSTFRPFDGTMHIRTDGKPLKPLLDMEIPVEAITQNLASFVDLEGVERTVNEYEELTGDDNNEQLL